MKRKKVTPIVLTAPQGELLSRKTQAFNRYTRELARAEQDLVELLVAYGIDPESYKGYDPTSRRVLTEAPK